MWQLTLPAMTTIIMKTLITKQDTTTKMFLCKYCKKTVLGNQNAWVEKGALFCSDFCVVKYLNAQQATPTSA